MSRNARPQRNKHGFVNIEYVRCPDCEVEGHLRNDGGAIVIEGGALRGATRDVGVVTAAHGCPTCKGKGAIRADDLEALLGAGIDHASLVGLDPYALEVRTAIERRERNLGS